jgi:hypothetical protein
LFLVDALGIEPSVLLGAEDLQSPEVTNASQHPLLLGTD